MSGEEAGMASVMPLDDIRIAVIGLGYVGLPLAVAFGRIRPVLGFDTKVARIEALRRGEDVTLETEAEDLNVANLQAVQWGRGYTNVEHWLADMTDATG